MTTNSAGSCAVVIVAAGRGERAGLTEGPKQYRDIAGKKVLTRTIAAFQAHQQVQDIVVVIHADDHDMYSSATINGTKLMPPVTGGATRQDSVFAGLEALREKAPNIVLIHDAARPFVDQNTISRVIEGLSSADGSLPSLPVSDTMKRDDGMGNVGETVSRDGLHIAQTPQGFQFSTILDAHEAAQKDNRHDFTDDSALAEWAGITVKLVEGSPSNNKLTTQTDIKEAERKMAMSIPDVRTGHGYDVHQLVDGSQIRLCGVDIAHKMKLSGHSDADVGLHALTDALLATIADGDIGSHFPPSDPQWKGADSDQFLAHACNLVRQAGGVITHCDVTLVCEEPKIGPHRDAMRRAISLIIDVDIKRVSVKATTNERIGFIGREEGIAALATATVVVPTS